MFKYVLSKTNDDFVKAEPNKFASFYYAMSKFGNTHKVQFDTAQIQKYIDAYAEKDGNKHLKLGLTPGIHNPTGDGISANDFTGELTVTYCIATTEQLEQQSGINHIKTVTRGGFQKIESADDALTHHFTFDIMFSPNTSESKEQWKKKMLQHVRLFDVNDGNGNIVFNNPLPMDPNDNPSLTNPYYLTLNGVSDLSTMLGAGNYGLSKDTRPLDIYIETITINKMGGKKEFTVSIQLCGGKIIDIPISPY